MLVYLGYWWEAQLLVQQVGGEVVVLGRDHLTQTDGWVYQTSTETRTVTVRWLDVTHPVLASRRGLDETFMALNCDAGGRPLHFYTAIPPGAKIAYRSRSVGPRAPQPAPRTPVPSPLKALAPDLYLTDGRGHLAGELPGSVLSGPAYGYLDVQQWNAIVIARRGE